MARMAKARTGVGNAVGRTIAEIPAPAMMRAVSRAKHLLAEFEGGVHIADHAERIGTAPRNHIGAHTLLERAEQLRIRAAEHQAGDVFMAAEVSLERQAGEQIVPQKRLLLLPGAFLRIIGSSPFTFKWRARHFKVNGEEPIMRRKAAAPLSLLGAGRNQVSDRVKLCVCGAAW